MHSFHIVAPVARNSWPIHLQNWQLLFARVCSPTFCLILRVLCMSALICCG